MLSRRIANGRNLVIGIRREDPKRIWERRTPLTPDDVQRLLSKLPVEVHIVPCDRRVFPISEYIHAGAKVSEDPSLPNADIIIGIKEVPLPELDNGLLQRPRFSMKPQTHFMFSHTHKGQPYNTPLLARFAAPDGTPKEAKMSSAFPRLIDYELLTDSTGKRTVGFGWFAGVAGVLESLSSMAHSHLEQGIASPFLYTPRPHSVPSLDEARTQLRSIGSLIASTGTPPALGPFVIGLTGRGQVSQGCLSMLSELPIQNVRVQDLDALVRDPNTPLNRVYLVHAQPEDYLFTHDGKPYSRERYYSSPESYKSVFHERVSSTFSITLTSPTHLRLMSNTQLLQALQTARDFDASEGGQGKFRGRMENIGDISCDIEGGLECLSRSSTISEPAYTIKPSSLASSSSTTTSHLPPVKMMAVDILPASIPLDASQHFSKVLGPYLESLVTSSSKPSDSSSSSTFEPREKGAENLEALDRATIARHGSPRTTTRVASSEESKSKDAKKQKGSAKRKNILLLGSGMVAKPTVDMIAERGKVDGGVRLVIASNALHELQSLAAPHPDVSYRMVDMSNPSTYIHLIREAELNFHPVIAKECIAHGSHLVTASYISDKMSELDSSAKKADVLLLNEIGLDPGIDHCSAIELFDRIRASNQQIVSFTSFCGGLPAPYVSNVPLRYKFSWRPQGVLTAAQNDAVFKLGGKIHQVPGNSLLKSAFSGINLGDGFEHTLEGLPNRDSLKYADTYNLKLKELNTLLRGTLRYPGFSKLMNNFISLGLASQSTTIQLDSWGTFIRQCLLAQYPTHNGAIPGLQELISQEDMPELTDALRFLGLIPGQASNFVSDPSSAMPPLPKDAQTPLDIFAYLLASKLQYAPNEPDMVVLTHEVIAIDKLSSSASPAAGGALPTQTVYTSSLVSYGASCFPGSSPSSIAQGQYQSAMSRTVGIPVAIAALSIVDGSIPLRGVVGPTHSSIYTPVLEGLARVGLGMRESVRKMEAGGLGAALGLSGEAMTVQDTLVGQMGGGKKANTPSLGDLMGKWKGGKGVEGKAQK
ncbi:Saccharopine dehydrogenase-domain-containing protein [Coprinopsis sp. MPI-PUGE-AT-0042]|nr:Saccharopine dehydrogenase-domain-containing protein [Coprinopsis sp. MPI-PUGE-AT-0042]